MARAKPHVGLSNNHLNPGMVQAWVGHFVTPLKRREDRFVWWVKNQKPHKKHKDLTNTITMVMEPLVTPAVWIWWTHATWGVGSLAHVRSDAAIEAI